jgi:hypothetical protein
MLDFEQELRVGPCLIYACLSLPALFLTIKSYHAPRQVMCARSQVSSETKGRASWLENI